MKKQLRICITGPESSGKTALAESIGKRFSETEVVYEYAREFLEARLPAMEYTKEDLLFIGEKQRQLICEARAPRVITDTDYLVLHIWMSEVFGDTQTVFLNWFKEDQPDLIFLCAPDIEWQPDPLRVNETDRWRLFELYEEALKNEGKSYTVVKGLGPQREEPVMISVQDLFEKNESK